MTAIEVDSVTVRYREVVALERATLTVDPGRICGLVGMNGSGKSTLFKAIMGMVKPTEGTVAIHGLSPAAARREGAVGYVPQSETVDWDFPISVREVVMMGRYGKQNWMRHPRSRDREAVAHALEQLELTGLADRQIGQLSGGQRKRAFVARGIAQGASVLLLDEPFAGVDKRTEATITSLLRSLAAEGAAILVASHDLTELPRLCDDAVLLHRRVLVQGTPDEVLTTDNLARAFGVDPLRRPEEVR